MFTRCIEHRRRHLQRQKIDLQLIDESSTGKYPKPVSRQGALGDST